MVATLTEHTATSADPLDKPYEIRDRGGRASIKGLLLRVQPSGTKTYYVEIKRGSRERIGDASAYTLAKARIKAKSILGKAADGYDFKADRRYRKVLKATTLESYLEWTFKDHAEANIVGHRKMLAGLKKNFEFVLSKPMTDITEMDMARWRKSRSKVSLETQRRELTNLKSVLNHAVRSKAIPSHQLSLYRVKGTLQEGEGEAKVRYLTEAEEKRLRDALCARESEFRQARIRANKHRAERGYLLHPEIGPLEYTDHIKPITLLALNTGLRRGDLFGLKWEHIDLARRQIRKVIEKTSHVKRKAGKKAEPAVLPLSGEAHAILSQSEKHRKPVSEYVFPSPVTGGRLRDIKKGFGGVLVDAKITNFRFHDLRHTFATRLVMAGVDINTVRELMTHADIKMTLVYAHLSPDHKAAALERAFGGEGI
jgi:integrase